MLDTNQVIRPYPCRGAVEIDRPLGVVPHHNLGENPFPIQFQQNHGIPAEAALGGAKTLYPEYRDRLRQLIKAESCEWPLSVTRLASRAALAASVLCAASAHAELRTTHVAGNVYMITGAGANVAVSVGTSGVLTVDAGGAASAQQLLAEIRKTSTGALRYVIDTSVAPDHIGGNQTLRNAGATFTGGNATVVGGVDVGAAIVAHEARAAPHVLRPASADRRAAHRDVLRAEVRPLLQRRARRADVPAGALDDTNVAVHFRRSDVIVTGDVFRMDGYPVIDLANGGSIDGVLAALNSFIDLAVSDTLSEGGTLLVPGPRPDLRRGRPRALSRHAHDHPRPRSRR